eukprot:TRINITY_DN11278_c0_g1_i3.p1 TRINITY_DN11278_c0_g1~~TRINITY_DN11278_c0_g1_i3.p1  ORF type:complete len:957 (+),score=73.94 TRINITY_DN11278_c0_g1_i3:107-2977(+)
MAPRLAFAERLDIASLEGHYLPYVLMLGKLWPIKSKHVRGFELRTCANDTIILDYGKADVGGGNIIVEGKMKGRCIIPCLYWVRFFWCFFFQLYRHRFDENLDLITNVGLIYRKVRPWLDRLIEQRGSLVSLSDGELAKIAVELSTLDPLDVSIESRLAFARRLQRGVSYAFLLEHMQSDESDEHDYTGPENAFSLEGVELSQANLYCSCASEPPCGMLAGFVSYTWRCSAALRSQGLQECLLQCYGTDVDAAGSLQWQHAHLWIDKFSSPQGGLGLEQLSRFGFFFQEYIAVCPRMFMLLSPEYLNRLWCRFEIITFLALHSIDDVYVAVRPFLNDDESVWATYQEQLRSSSSTTAMCAYESDRAILIKLETDTFHDSVAADQLVKFAVLALLGRAFLRSSYPDELRAHDSLFNRLLTLCRELDFSDLAEALIAVRESEDLQHCIDCYGDIPTVVRCEFQSFVSPLLIAKQKQTMKPTSQLQLLKDYKQVSRVSVEMHAKESHTVSTSANTYEDEGGFRLEVLRRALKWSTYQPGNLQRTLRDFADVNRNTDSSTAKGRVYTDLQADPRLRVVLTATGIIFFIVSIAIAFVEGHKSHVHFVILTCLLASLTLLSSVPLFHMKRFSLIKYVHAAGMCTVGLLNIAAGIFDVYPFTHNDPGSIGIGVGLIAMFGPLVYNEALLLPGFFILVGCASWVNPVVQAVSGNSNPNWPLMVILPLVFTVWFCGAYIPGRRDLAEVVRRNEPFACAYRQLYDAIVERERCLLETLNQKAAAMQAACAGHPLKARQLRGNQALRDLDELYKMAVGVCPLFAKEVDMLCDVVLADPSPPVSVKGAGRAIQKIWRSYGGDVSKLKDVCRGAIVVKDMRRLHRCLEAIDRSKTLEVVDIKNRFRSGGADRTCYRDINLRLCIVSPDAIQLGVDKLVVELQLILRSFWDVKTNHGHAEYVRFRDVVGR